MISFLVEDLRKEFYEIKKSDSDRIRVGVLSVISFEIYPRNWWKGLLNYVESESVLSTLELEDIKFFDFSIYPSEYSEVVSMKKGLLNYSYIILVLFEIINNIMDNDKSFDKIFSFKRFTHETCNIFSNYLTDFLLVTYFYFLLRFKNNPLLSSAFGLGFSYLYFSVTFLYGF